MSFEWILDDVEIVKKKATASEIATFAWPSSEAISIEKTARAIAVAVSKLDICKNGGRFESESATSDNFSLFLKSDRSDARLVSSNSCSLTQKFDIARGNRAYRCVADGILREIMNLNGTFP